MKPLFLQTGAILRSNQIHVFFTIGTNNNFQFVIFCQDQCLWSVGSARLWFPGSGSVENQPNTAKNKFTLKTKISIGKRDYKISWFLNGLSSFSIK